MFVVSHCNCICSNHLGSILLAWPCASAQHSSWQRSCQEDLAQRKVSCSHEGFPREEAEAAISWWSAIHPHWLHAGGAVHDGVVWYTCGWQESVELCVFAFESWSAFYFIHSWRGLAMFAYLRPLYVKGSIQMNGIALQRIDWGGPGPGWFGHKDQGASEFRTGAASAGPFALMEISSWKPPPFCSQKCNCWWASWRIMSSMEMPLSRSCRSWTKVWQLQCPFGSFYCIWINILVFIILLAGIARVPAGMASSPTSVDFCKNE